MTRVTVHETMRITIATGCSAQCCFLSEVSVPYTENLFHRKSRDRVLMGVRLALYEGKEYILPLQAGHHKPQLTISELPEPGKESRNHAFQDTSISGLKFF